MSLQQDKAQLLRDFHMEKELMFAEKEQEVEHVRETLKRDLEEAQLRAKEKSTADLKVCLK